MCGISVIISQNNKAVATELIQASTDIIHHRGPDYDGHYFGSNFSFGHRRLAIIDLSADGVQPMHRHDLVITFNGEIFNYIELREELVVYGYSFETKTDTEVILNAYLHWGHDCQNKFTGMWSFVIFDPAKNSLFCSRDRYCVKPFLYTQCGDYFLIGSEIKQFTIHPEFVASLNLDTTFDFLEQGLLNHNEHTFFKNVFSLSGGHQLIYDLSEHSFIISKWYNPNLKGTKIDFESAKAGYDKLLKESIKLRLRSDVTVGVALSGGLDSSGIVCITKEIDQEGDYKAIISCYEHAAYDERVYAEHVATKTGVHLKKTFPHLDDLLTKKYLEKMIWHQEQPVSSCSHFSEFSVFQEARNQGITVMLCGQGPDEHTGGYGNFFTYHYLHLLKKGKIRKLYHELRARDESLKRNVMLLVGFLFLNALRHQTNKFINYTHFAKQPLKPKFGFFSKMDSVRKLSIDQIFVTSIPYQAHSEDRNSMCFSIESRSPFLDHLLLENAVRLPDKFKIHQNKNKWILRETLNPYLPKEIYERTDKMGFVAPDEIWFKESKLRLRPLLVEACNAIEKLINKEEILHHYDSFTQGEKPYSSIFLRVFSLAELCKLYKIAV
jgi:asparagine synthase (glutamine-hydrolysing)